MSADTAPSRSAGARRLARRLVVALGDAVGRAQVAAVCRRGGANGLVVLDIDNTLADTWPSFLTSYPNHRVRMARLEPLPNIKAVAHDEPVAAGAAVLFLSHRNLWEWPLTYRWLRRHGYAVTPRNLVLVASPATKVAHVRRCLREPRFGGTITMWDDLSHGHETGTMAFYTEVIDAIGDLTVDYRGWPEILAVTGREFPPAT